MTQVTTTRTLGRSEIEVSALGMGCWQIAGITRAPLLEGSGAFGWGDVDDSESIRAIHAALAGGMTFFETADVYGGGHSERLLGQALAGRRQEVVLATKFGFAFDEHTRQMLGREASPAYIRRACEGSLSRLRTDYIDFYLFHNGEYDERYLDDVCDVLDRLVEAGKIRHYGWCTWPDRLAGVQRFAQHRNCAATEYIFNVLEDNADMLALCDEHNLASIVIAPLAMSLLGGKVTQNARFAEHDVRQGWNLQSGKQAEQLKRVEQLREILTSDGRTLAQGALAWLWARSPRVVPIPGCKTVQQAEENAAALQFGPLPPQQMAEIEQIMGRSQSA